MSSLWAYFWPAIGVGLLSGVIAGLVGFRPRGRRTLALILGAVAALALAMLWHGPLGAGDRLASRSETAARQALDHYELPQISAHLHHAPLTRRLVLSGPADDFQIHELQRVMSQVPGVSQATWSRTDAGLPLIAEACGAALVGFLLGLLLAYLVELRRRYNAQWSW
jgi:hypothetical protein